MHGMFLPKEFFVTSGTGMDISELNAFDLALKGAGVSECNLVTVSSILPPDPKEIDPVRITPGTITFCVMTRMDGRSGETIGAGLAYGICEKDGVKFGLVSEHHGYHSKTYLKQILNDKLNRMAEIREVKLCDSKFCLESMEVKSGLFGTVVALLVYVPWDSKTGERII